MSRFLLLVCTQAVVLFWPFVESWAQAASSPDTKQSGIASPNSSLTSDQAIAAVRSKEPNPGASFQVIREIASSRATQEAAQSSLHEASSHHVSLYDNGIFLDLLSTGGFLILEVDDATGNAISLHLVSRATNGHAVIESHPVEGEVSASLAQDLISESADFVDVLFATPINSGALENRFDRGRFPESREPDEDETENLFATPSAMEKAGADERRIRELAVLLGAINTWPIRYAISSPIFPADPTRALEAAVRKFDALGKEFVHTNKQNLDFMHVLQDLKSVRTSEELRNRIATLSHFNNFLEGKLLSQETSMTFLANRSISAIPLRLGSTGPPEEIRYPVMTSSGIIIGWKLSSTGAP